MAVRRDIRIDLARLPDDLAALVEDLRPGEAVTLVRDGNPVASITAAEPVADRRGSGVTVVATAMELSAAARARLSATLGGAYVVLDMNAAPSTADVLIVPPVSPQLIGRLRSTFPRARVIVAEIEDPEFGVRFSGPVQRLADAGAEAYLPASTVEQLAIGLDRAVTGRQIAGPATTPMAIELQ
jgi:antitoxin (DNA-binding transcriptional repressor) of toxin-antitoxin stability system